MDRFLEALRRFLSTPAGRAAAAMAVLVVAIGAFFLIRFLTAPPEGEVLPLTPSEFVQGEVLVKFRPGTPAEARRAVQAEENATEISIIPGINVARLRVPEGSSVGELVERLRRNPNVEYAEPNFVATSLEVPNDPYWPTRQMNLQKIGAAAAWDITPGSRSVVIAIADSGLFADHEDLRGKALPGATFIDGLTSTIDEHGHGTIVAGMAASHTNNGLGVAGLGRESSLMSLRIAGADGFSNYGAIAAAAVYAGDNGARVLNISYGGTAASETLTDAMNYAFSRGVVITAAVGNSNVSSIAFPAAIPVVIAVGSTTVDDVKSNFSNYGPGLDVMAPGSGVYSTTRGGTYAGYSGTSFAAPTVAGLAALIFATRDDLPRTAAGAQQVVDIITGTVADLGDRGWDPVYGYGRIDAAAAVRRAAETAGSPPPPSTATPTSAPPTATRTATPVPPTPTATPGAPTPTTEVQVAAPTSTPVPPTATAVPPTPTRTATTAATATATTSAPSARTETFGGRVDQRGSQTANHTIAVSAAGSLTASLDWSGGANLDLALLDPTGQQVAAAASPRGKPENIVYQATRTGTYTLRVTASSGQANYTLTTTHP